MTKFFSQFVEGVHKCVSRMAGYVLTDNLTFAWFALAAILKVRLTDEERQSPIVAANAETEWAARFAKTIVRQSHRMGWQPFHKQLFVMQRLVAEMFMQRGNDEGEFDVIE